MITGRHLIFPLLAVGLAVLAGCATLDENQCRIADWSQLGRADGAEGRPSARVDRHAEACRRYNLPVDATQWRRGWEEGNRLYCTPSRALEEGRRGRSYANVCTGAVAAAFDEHYRAGRRVYDAEIEVERIGNELGALYRYAGAPAAPEVIRELRFRESALRSQLMWAETELMGARRDYARYARRLATG